METPPAIYRQLGCIDGFEWAWIQGVNEGPFSVRARLRSAVTRSIRRIDTDAVVSSNRPVAEEPYQIDRFT